MTEDQQHEWNICTQLEAALAAAPDTGTFCDVLARWADNMGVEIENDDGLPVRLVGNGLEGGRVGLRFAQDLIARFAQELEE